MHVRNGVERVRLCADANSNGHYSWHKLQLSVADRHACPCGPKLHACTFLLGIGARYNSQGAYTLSPQDKMAKLTVDGVGEFEVPQGKRLVLALEDEAGVDQLHACGGNARCTTCRVEFLAGEPNQMTIAEKQVLAARGLSGVRLSCQILCDHDMSVRIISRLAGSGRKDVGSRPADDIQPQPVQFVPK